MTRTAYSFRLDIFLSKAVSCGIQCRVRNDNINTGEIYKGASRCLAAWRPSPPISSPLLAGTFRWSYWWHV